MGGLTGQVDPKLSDITSSALIAQKDQFGNRNVVYEHDWLKPPATPFGPTIVNRGGQIGVMPCGEALNYNKVLRRPAGNKFTGLYPQVGWARNQEKGLAYSVDKPINLPIAIPTSSVNGALPSKIKGIR